jgi:hypothetical protein
MPWGVAAAVGGSIAGAATSSLLAPGTSGGGNSYYTPTGLGTADTSWQNLLNQQLDTQQNIQWQNPGLYQALQGGMYAQNQYSPAYQSAADTAGAGYGNLANTLNQQSQNAYGTQQSLLNAGQQAYQTSLDPQNALYNRSVQQLQDQTGATNSMYGLGSSAAGAGVANQALSNFNIDWQNNQLSRQLQGLQGYGQAAQAAGQYGQYGTGLAEAAPGYQLQAGQVPYQTAQGIAGVPGQLIGNYNSQLEQGPLSSASAINGQIIPYLNYGSGAQSIPYQSATQGAGAAGALVSQGIQGLGSNPQVQSALGNFFGGGNSYGAQSSLGYGGANFNTSPYYSGGGANSGYGFTMP